ncbi:MAG: F0F1 ATP synthase subunit delta [Anaerolineae bacterium]|jgi:F0F1-type ATP synthase membrane subunit b/b'|nr:F0F1 ATP synthase subunit delta [Anaerolineae bacterium]
MLDLNITTIIWQIVNFLVLAAALYFLLFKQVMRVVERRTEEKNRLVNELREKNEAAEKLQAELQAQLDNADSLVNEIIDKAEAQIQANHERMIERAREEAENILGQAHVESLAMQQQAMEKYYERILDSVIDVSGRVIGKAAPNELNEIFVREINDTLWNLGRGNIRQVQTLRSSLGDRKPTVYVTTAFDLTPEQQRMLVRTFSALANRNVSVEIEVDPSLVMGARIRIGDMIVENSIASRLNDLRDEVREKLDEWMPHE